MDNFNKYLIKSYIHWAILMQEKVHIFWTPVDLLQINEYEIGSMFSTIKPKHDHLLFDDLTEFTYFYLFLQAAHTKLFWNNYKNNSAFIFCKLL